MNRRARLPILGFVLAAGFSLAACSSEAVDTGSTDPSKLSEDLENRAKEIEEKADMAAVAAERDASAELASLREEAETRADEDSQNNETGEAVADSN